MTQTNDYRKTSYVIGGILSLFATVAMLFAFLLLTSYQKYTGSIIYWIAIIGFIIFVVVCLIEVDAISTLGLKTYKDLKSMGLIIHILDKVVKTPYYGGKSPLTHIVILAHGFCMSLAIYFTSYNSMLSMYDSVSTNVLLGDMKTLEGFVLFYVIVSVIAAIVFLFEYYSSTDTIKSVLTKHNDFVQKQNEKADKKFSDISESYNSKIEKIIDEVSSMEIESIEHGELEEVKI